jgi:hypothetical protein
LYQLRSKIAISPAAETFQYSAVCASPSSLGEQHRQRPDAKYARAHALGDGFDRSPPSPAALRPSNATITRSPNTFDPILQATKLNLEIFQFLVVVATSRRHFDIGQALRFAFTSAEDQAPR